MDINDEQFIKECMNEIIQQILEEMQEQINEIFKSCLESELYDFYSPNTYERTYRLLDSVKTHIDYSENVLYVYCDINEGMYFSVNGEDISKDLTTFLFEGHTDNTGIQNEYHSYEQRQVLEVAKQRIESETGLEVEIVDEESDQYSSYF